MPAEIKDIKSLCFDLGNTLLEFGPKQIRYQFEMLEKALKELFGHCDASQLKKIRDRQIVQPFKKGYVENNFHQICEELVTELYNQKPSQSQVSKILRVRYTSMIDIVELPNGVLSLLEKLKKRFKLALLSNYPDGKSIRDSLKKLGIYDIFDSITISGEVGFVKPHPKPFEIMLSDIKTQPSDTLFVGDNWLADIQGAKRLGLKAILTTQFEAYENHKRTKDDFDPDATVNHINEIQELV